LLYCGKTPVFFDECSVSHVLVQRKFYLVPVSCLDRVDDGKQKVTIIGDINLIRSSNIRILQASSSSVRY